MPDIRVFSGAQVIADYMIDEDTWDSGDGEMPSTEEQLIAHARKAVVEDGHMTAKEAEGATYMVLADEGLP